MGGVIVLLGLGAFLWTQRLYPPPALSPRFPRQPSEFRNMVQREAAKAQALQILAERPDSSDAHVDMAIACFEGGNEEYVKGLEYLERARDLGALDERLFYYAGIMYEAQGLAEYAIAEFEKYLRRHPEDLEIRLRLANLFYRMEDVDKSIDGYRQVLAGRPGDPLVSYNLAIAYRDQKAWAEGLEALKPFLVTGKPLPAGGYRLLGDLHRGDGNPARGLEAYDKERTASGESPEVATGMAQAYEDLGQVEPAVERWQKVLELDPANREARTRLRRLKHPAPNLRR